MKHGRRHAKLKEQAYVARQDARGSKTPYPPLDVAEPTAPPPPPAPDPPLAARLTKKNRHALRWLRDGADEDNGEGEDGGRDA